MGTLSTNSTNVVDQAGTAGALFGHPQTHVGQSQAQGHGLDRRLTKTAGYVKFLCFFGQGVNQQGRNACDWVRLKRSQHGVVHLVPENLEVCEKILAGL